MKFTEVKLELTIIDLFKAKEHSLNLVITTKTLP